MKNTEIGRRRTCLVGWAGAGGLDGGNKAGQEAWEAADTLEVSGTAAAGLDSSKDRRQLLDKSASPYHLSTFFSSGKGVLQRIEGSGTGPGR